MKKIVSVVLMVTLLLGSMGDGRLTEAQNAELQAVEYNNSFRRITAGPDEEAGSLRIFCKDETAVRAEIYAAYEGESFSVRGAMEEGEGLLSFPEEGKSVDFYIQTESKEGESIKSNIVTFTCEDGYYYETTKDSDGDGIPDGYEIRDLGTDPEKADTDGDGFPDGYEVQVLHTDPSRQTEDGDYDGDGLTNREEMEKGSHPYMADSDFDGTVDKKDESPLVNTGETIVKEERLPELKRGYYDVKETRQEEDGSVTEIVTNILSGRIQWVKTGENYCRYYYDNTGRKPVAELIRNGKSGEWTVTQLAYAEGQLTNINQNGKQIEISYAENGQVSQYKEEGNLLYEKQYEGGLLSGITYGNGDSIQYQYNRRKAWTEMEINGEKAFTWDYDKEGLVTRCTDEREKIVEEQSYDEWLEPAGKIQRNGLSVHYTENEDGRITVYEAGEETKEVRTEYNDNEAGESSCTVQYPQEVEIRIMQKEGKSVKTILQSSEEIVSEEKAEKQKEKVKKEKLKKIKEEKEIIKKKKQKKNIKRDKSGNLTEKAGVQYSWEGLQLKTCRKNGVETEYAYDSQGNRIRKTVNGITSTYGVEEGNLVYEKTGDKTIWYYYGADGLPAAFETGDQMYLYEKDEAGNIIALYNIKGEIETEYIYDENGNLLEIQGNQEAGEINPFRYQSAYYDGESGLYYSYGRYYDTEEGAFLNADALYEPEPEKAENYLSASYYGAAAGESEVVTYGASGEVSPSTDNRLFAWNSNCLNYNCYAYAINYTDSRYDPGRFSGKALDTIGIARVKENTISDLLAQGRLANEVGSSYVPKVGESLICFKILAGYDYHFMKYVRNNTYWRHKPGNTAILEYLRSPKNATWVSEGYNGTTGKWFWDRTHYYNSSTVYIVSGRAELYK